MELPQARRPWRKTVSGTTARGRHLKPDLEFADPLSSAQRIAYEDGVKPVNYVLKRWTDFAPLLDDGRICLINNAAQRSLRGVAIGEQAMSAPVDAVREPSAARREISGVPEP